MTFPHEESSDMYTVHWVESTVTSTEQPPEFRIQNDKKKKHCSVWWSSYRLSLSRALSIDFSSPLYLLTITLSQPEPQEMGIHQLFISFLHLLCPPFADLPQFISTSSSYNTSPPPLPQIHCCLRTALSEHFVKNHGCACSTADTLYILKHYYYY